MDVQAIGEGRAPQGTSVGTRERLPMGRRHLRGGGVGRTPRRWEVTKEKEKKRGKVSWPKGRRTSTVYLSWKEGKSRRLRSAS